MNASPNADTQQTPVSLPPQTEGGRDANGRFAQGNPGGPGNPYYRRQAQLKRILLASVTEEDIQSVMQVLVGLARGGDLAAIKQFLEYVVGKPAKEVDPDREELHEWQLQQQTPRLEQVMDVMAHSIAAPRANEVTRDMVAIVGDCHLQTLGQHLRDGTDYVGRPIAPPLGTPPLPTDPNGGKRPGASARRMAAAVPRAVRTGDIGEETTAWHDRLDEEMARAVQTGDIGALMAHFRSRPPRGTSPGQCPQHGSD
jgi:hypothetical protein